MGEGVFVTPMASKISWALLFMDNPPKGRSIMVFSKILPYKDRLDNWLKRDLLPKEGFSWEKIEGRYLGDTLNVILLIASQEFLSINITRLKLKTLVVMLTIRWDLVQLVNVANSQRRRDIYGCWITVEFFDWII